MFKRSDTDHPLHDAEDFLREFQKIDDAAADDPTLRMLGFDYLITVAKATEAELHVHAAQVSFECQQLEIFRREMSLAALKMGIDVHDLAAFQTGTKVNNQVVFRMVVQLASRVLDSHHGYVDLPFAGLMRSRLVH